MSTKKSMASKTSGKSNSTGSRVKSATKSAKSKPAAKTASKSAKSKLASKPVAKETRKASSKPADLQVQVQLLTEKIASLKKNIQQVASGNGPQSTPSVVSSPPSALRRPKPIPVYEVKEVHPVDFQMPGNRNSHTDEDEDGFYISILDRARIQWLMGDWEGLSKIDLEQIQSHPDRAKLALFGAFGRIQTGHLSDARKYLSFAKNRGCSPKLVQTILLGGIHCSMYAANLLNGREKKAVRHQSELKLLGVLDAMSGAAHSLNRQQPLALMESKKANAEIPPRIKSLAVQAANDPNPSEKSLRLLQTEDLSSREKFLFLFQLAAEFHKKGNKLVAASYLEEASHLLPPNQSADCLWLIVKKLLELGLPEDAFSKRLTIPEVHPLLNADESEMLQNAGLKLLEKIYDFKGHGHELLISILQKHAGQLRTECAGRKPTLIEIGTTRESPSGQGSTRRLAELCHRENFHFITVDMDRACTNVANQMFMEKGFSFEAIHSKGEDFLASYSGPMDAIFLDAYDFDHGRHNELRQSRYEKFLGTRISEADCHQMHLNCALEITKKSQPWTLVCVDDTWLHFGHWTAKGTLAVPYLLEMDYQLLDVRNKAALMGSRYWLEKIQTESPY